MGWSQRKRMEEKEPLTFFHKCLLNSLSNHLLNRGSQASSNATRDCTSSCRITFLDRVPFFCAPHQRKGIMKQHFHRQLSLLEETVHLRIQSNGWFFSMRFERHNEAYQSHVFWRAFNVLVKRTLKQSLQYLWGLQLLNQYIWICIW